MLAVLALLVPFTPLHVRSYPAGDEPWTQAQLEAVSEQIRGDIETMRGMNFIRPVQVKVTDKAGFIDYMRKRQALTQSPERLARDETVAKMLGLIPHDMDLMATVEALLKDQVGGFYDPSSDTFFLMDTFTGDIAKIILAHELTHALDDQMFDIDGTLKKMHEDSDAEFAFQAVVEGSGTAAMNQWTVTHLKNLDKQALLDSADIGTAGLDEAPPYLWKPLIAAYLRGEGFLTRSRAMNISLKAAKVEDIRRAFEDPPRSSEQILHPDKYWDEKKRDDPRRIEFDAGRPTGWELLGEDTLGEIVLALLTTPAKERTGLDVKNPFAMLGLAYTNDAAEGWGGDRLILLGKGEDRWLELVTLWDSPKDAAEFREAVSMLCAGGARADDGGPFSMQLVSHEGADVVVLRATKGRAALTEPAIPWDQVGSTPSLRGQ